ncbi:hypothetical protein LRS03_18110 [Rhizobacter sp. J219]|uniref:hypothetical protein n=1 Tax=Rhizobacter sp. J219 TaxID=2898430 RepID=UPI002151E9BD|nr:hypothetical protein [Rhizobacter sp. J219]MCR5884657.1 hypothetical protein [Rhizobacter sp. J219]
MPTSNWNFSPNIHWPLSGSVTQDISPSLVFRAKDAQVEIRVLREVASYGRQIGKLSEVLLKVVDALPKGKLDDATVETVGQLRVMAENIRRIKEDEKVLPSTEEEARAMVADLKRLYPGI